MGTALLATTAHSLLDPQTSPAHRCRLHPCCEKAFDWQHSRRPSSCTGQRAVARERSKLTQSVEAVASDTRPLAPPTSQARRSMRSGTPNQAVPPNKSQPHNLGLDALEPCATGCRRALPWLISEHNSRGATRDQADCVIMLQTFQWRTQKARRWARPGASARTRAGPNGACENTQPLT